MTYPVQDLPPPAKHQSREAIEAVARAAAMQTFGSRVTLSVLAPDKPTVGDATTKLLVTDHRGAPIAVALCGAGEAGALVRRNVSRAEKAHRTLGPELGANVLLPFAQGEEKGAVYALYPYMNPLPSGPLLGRLHYWRIGPHVLSWLRDATAKTRQTPPTQAVRSRFAAPLQDMADSREIPHILRDAATQALERLSSGFWAPRHVLTHYDFWIGNILLPRAPFGPFSLIRREFVITDWPGSTELGYGIFDLIRMAHSIRLSPRSLKREIRRHCEILDCEPIDASSHLATALAVLGARLEHFPLDRYIQMSRRCLATLEDAEKSR